MIIKMKDVAEMVTVVVPENHDGKTGLDRIYYIESIINKAPLGNKMICWLTEDMLIDNFKYKGEYSIVYGRTSVAIRNEDEPEDIILDTFELENPNDIKIHVGTFVDNENITIGLNNVPIWEFGNEIYTQTIVYGDEVIEDAFDTTNKKQYILFVVMRDSVPTFREVMESFGLEVK